MYSYPTIFEKRAFLAKFLFLLPMSCESDVEVHVEQNMGRQRNHYSAVGLTGERKFA
jgi:hypothetical protein